jgi:acetyl esterase/lipase
MVRRLSLALARTGLLVFIPDLPGISSGELSPQTLAQSIAFVEAAANSREAADGRIALAGVSVGGSLALLTAADPRVQRHLSVVTCVAPFGDLAAVMRLATTSTYRDGERLRHHTPSPFLRIGLARSLAAMLPEASGTVNLCEELRGLNLGSSSASELPVRAFREAGIDAERLYDLLANTDPARFEDLYGVLPAYIRAAVVALSPIHVATTLQTPVEIATAPGDTYFPAAEARALVSALPHAQLTVTSLLTHATPRLSPRYLTELRQLNGFFVRAIGAALGPSHTRATSVAGGLNLPNV